MKNGRETAPARGIVRPDPERWLIHGPPGSALHGSSGTEAWKSALANAIRDPNELIDRMELPERYRLPAQQAARSFGIVVPESYLARMVKGDPNDPLLRQVLPMNEELSDVSGFTADAVGDALSRRAPGLLQKYHGRALLILAGRCAVNCRYCFRRQYPYETEPMTEEEWEPALKIIAEDDSLQEVILSGGDPLLLSNRRLECMIQRLEQIPHLRRLRLHSRMPIVLPQRVTPGLIAILTESRLTPVMVVHANHPRENTGDCAEALRSLVGSGITTLNQSVLLKGINDDADTLCELSESLVNLGVIPYYLHQLDRVQGAAHFEVPEEQGRALMAELHRRLPGYAVPRYVRELAGADGKIPLGGDWGKGVNG